MLNLAGRLLLIVMLAVGTSWTYAAASNSAADVFRTVSLEDLEDMRGALLAYLRASSLEDRDQLVRVTEGSKPAIDGDGTKRIGLWRLTPERSGLFLTLRTASGSQLTVNYRATVEGADSAWRIAGIKAQFVQGSR